MADSTSGCQQEEEGARGITRGRAGKQVAGVQHGSKGTAMAMRIQWEHPALGRRGGQVRVRRECTQKRSLLHGVMPGAERCQQIATRYCEAPASEDTNACSARSIARPSAADLFTVSSHSLSGTESATRPAPACGYWVAKTTGGGWVSRPGGRKHSRLQPRHQMKAQQ